MIQCENIMKKYRGKEVLKDISCQISFANNVLSIVEIENRVTYNLVMLDIWQLEEYYESSRGSYSRNDGPQILYLNIPKHINIINKSGMIYLDSAIY
ncbi:hypothetical protein [Metasolibacillus meyeri]|uniref:hypothetical protein n=1 Tax=Metasolibacillus meyeri TaxID=1071052 RepID=UPI000D306FCE|nr:hypothetical protein [Metasolibacillus meyeri]